MILFDHTKSFTIKVTYRIAEETPTPLRAPSPPIPAPPHVPNTLVSLSAAFEKLFLAEDKSDVAFEIGGEVFPAHKLILTARVPAFEKMFASGMAEASTGRIRIEDTDAASFKQFLNFIYCGKIPEELNDFADSLLPIAEKYGVQGLKDACEVALKSQISQDNIIHTLILAHLYRCSDLKREGFKCLAECKTSLGVGDIDMLKPYPDLMVEAIRMM